MAYQDWFTQAASTSAVSNTLPPALIPTQNSVLNEQSVPSSYTSNNTILGGVSPRNTPVSSVSQINQIMNAINPSSISNVPGENTSGSGYGTGPMSWNAYSTSGSEGPGVPGTGTNNPGITQNYGDSYLNTTGLSSGAQDMTSSWNTSFGQNPDHVAGTNVLGGGNNWSAIGNSAFGALGNLYGANQITGGINNLLNTNIPNTGSLLNENWQAPGSAEWGDRDYEGEAAGVVPTLSEMQQSDFQSYAQQQAYEAGDNNWQDAQAPSWRTDEEGNDMAGYGMESGFGDGSQWAGDDQSRNFMQAIYDSGVEWKEHTTIDPWVLDQANTTAYDNVNTT